MSGSRVDLRISVSRGVASISAIALSDALGPSRTYHGNDTPLPAHAGRGVNTRTPLLVRRTATVQPSNGLRAFCA